MVTFAPLTLMLAAAENQYEPADYYTSDTEADGVRRPLLVVVAAGSRHAASRGGGPPSPALTGLVAGLLGAALPEVLPEVRVGAASSRIEAAPAVEVGDRYLVAREPYPPSGGGVPGV
jgi:hypothetical protein